MYLIFSCFTLNVSGSMCKTESDKTCHQFSLPTNVNLLGLDTARNSMCLCSDSAKPLNMFLSVLLNRDELKHVQKAKHMLKCFAKSEPSFLLKSMDPVLRTKPHEETCTENATTYMHQLVPAISICILNAKINSTFSLIKQKQ